VKHIRALIVEDEPLARDVLRRLVEGEDDIVLIDECADGITALKAIQRHRPELVFLDVRLPGLSGVDLLKKLDGSLPPAVIFVTAHDRYAVPAFAAHAVDFLLKPFTRERFRESLQRARHRLRGKPSLKPSLAVLAQNANRHSDSASLLSFKVGKRFVLVQAGEIEAIVASGAYSVIHTLEASHRTRCRVPLLEQKLPPGKFLRINRSTIINAERIKEIVRKEHGDGFVRLQSGREFSLARRWRAHWSVLMATDDLRQKSQ